jgi:hypothetical protein
MVPSGLMLKTKFTVDLRDAGAGRLSADDYDADNADGAVRLAVTQHMKTRPETLHHALVSRSQQAGSELYYFRYDHQTPWPVHVGSVVLHPGYPPS